MAAGMRLLERAPSGDRMLLTFSTKPGVSPGHVAARAKGRLQHAFRENATPVHFSRKLAVRSVGENTADMVQSYIHSQVTNAPFLDVRFRKRSQRSSAATKKRQTTNLTNDTNTRGNFPVKQSDPCGSYFSDSCYPSYSWFLFFARQAQKLERSSSRPARQLFRPDMTQTQLRKGAPPGELTSNKQHKPLITPMNTDKPHEFISSVSVLT